MEQTHLINTLTLELDKELSASEVGRLKSRILDAIDYCFNKYYPYSKTLQIENFSLDLGTIDKNNFEEEFIVRLSYMLDTEVGKLLQQENIDALIDQQNIFSDLELLIYFLKTGVMTSGSDAATPLFHRLIKKDLQSLRFNLEKTLDNEATKKRLFHQIKENQLDEYWLNVEPIVYLEIRRFNKKIQESVWGKQHLKLSKKELNDFLRKLTFDFMMNGNVSKSLSDYIKFFQLNFKKVQGFARDEKVHVSQLVAKSAKENELVEPFKSTRSIKRLIDELITYILDERASSLSVIKKENISKTFFRREIEEIVSQLTKSIITIKKFMLALERVYQTLNPNQIELFFQVLQRENKFPFQKELIELAQVIQLTRSVFSITLYDMGFLWVSDIINELKHQFKKKPILLFTMIDHISIKTGYGREYIIDKMMGSEGSEIAKTMLLKHRKKVTSLYKKLSVDSGIIHTYLYYLKSGIWELGDQSPDEVLIVLLRDYAELFILSLKKEHDDKVVWLRLIHGNELPLVEKVIMAFLQGVQRKKKFEKIIKSIERYEMTASFKKHIFERLITDPSWFDNLPFLEKGFDMTRIKEDLDSFFSQEQNIKDLSLVPMIDYLDQGKLEFDYSLIEILKMAKKLRKKDLIELSRIILFGSNSYQNKLKLQRIFEVFSWAQIDVLFVSFARQETKKRKAFENFHYLKVFLHSLFSENIYYYGYQQIAGFINNFSISDPQLNKSLCELLERVALKKDIVFTDLLSTIIAHLDPGEYSKLIALRRQLIQAQTVLETAKEKHLKITDNLLLLLNYLELGVWLSVDLDPNTSIKMVIEDNFDQLISQFEKRINHKIFWLRLLYQFDFDIVLKIILQVFKNASEFEALKKYLPELEQKDQNFRFKLLETFILIKMDVDKGENFEELFEYQVALFQKNDAETDSIDLKDIDLDERKIFNDFNLLLTVFFDNPTDSQADLVRTRFNSEIGNDVILNNFFINGQYRWILWERLFKKVSKADLISLLRLSLSSHIQNSWEIKFFHFFVTRNRFTFFKKSIILGIFKALHSKDFYELKNQFKLAWVILLKEKPKETADWLEDESFNQFISSSKAYDLISQGAQFKFEIKDLTELENDLLLLLSGQMGDLVQEVRLMASDWILNIAPVATTQSELKELLYLKLLSFATPRKVIDLNLLIRNFSPEMRLSVFTQIINFNIVEINQILHQQRLLYLFLECLLEDQSLLVQFFLNIDKKKLSKFLSLLSSQTLAKLMLLFDDKKDDEALLLAAVREFQETPSKSDSQPSTEAKDLALMRAVIEEGGISRTPFNRWSSFETFFIELLSVNLVKAVFFKEFDLSTVRQFLALLSADALTLLAAMFDDKKGDEALLLAAVREFQETPSKLDLQPSTEAKDLALLRVVIEEGGISRTPFNRWSSFETFFKDLLVRGVLTTQFFKEIESSTLNKFYKLLSSDLLISIESLFGADTPMLSPLHLLITSDEGAALEKEFLNLNDLGDLAPVSSFDLYPHRTFGILLEKVIELEFKEAETPYLNFQEFEFQFRNQLSIQSTIWQILTRQSIGKMKIFLRVLQQETLAELIKLIDYKFGGISFNEIMNSIKKANQKSMLELEVLMIIFGLSHDHYDQESLLKFLDDQINFFIIPDEFEVFLLALKKNEITLYYVDAFINFLKDRNKLNEGIFIYESEEAFNRILHFKREFFISRLRKDRDVEQVLISLFQRLPEKLISQYFNQMMPDYAGQWEPLWQSMVFSVSKIVFTSKLILLGLRNIQKIEFNILSGLLLAQLNPKKSVAPPKLTLSKAAKADLDQLKSLSYVSIKDDYLAHFDIYDFVEVVITTGTFPNWSAVHSVERFYEILVKLAKVDGHHFKLNIDALIKKSVDLDFLISFLGEKKFLSLYKIIRPSVHGQAQKIAKQFEQAFTAVVKKSVLTNYFILIILRYQHEYPTANDELIWDEMLDQWSISMQMSKIELIDLAGSQESQEISAYLESTKLNTITYANKELAWQGDIDFLLHLILYNEYPWWSIELDHQGFSKSENLVRLTNQMLNEHPKSFIEAVSMLKRPDGVFEKIIPIMKPQVIDRILLILSPQHGAFVVNFNILIKRWGYLKAKDEWITFLFRYFSHLESFDHDRFILSSVTFITKKTPFFFPKVKEQLLKITSDALHEGEMKFLPFMKLFNDLNLNDEVMPIPNTHLVQHHPNKDFIAIMTYYITTGSLPADYAFLIKSYLAFVRKIESYLNTGHEDVRVAIISVMENSDVRTRVVRNEKEDILFLITRALFPKHTKSLMEYKSDIIKLFTQIWPYIQPKIINELFYQTIYQSVLNAKFMNLNALDLVHLFLQQFKKVNQISFDFDMNAYAYLNISDKLVEMIVSFNTSKQVRDIPKENDSEVKLLPIVLDPIDDIESVKLEHRIEIKNAGIVIVWPYLDRFFQMLEMTEKGSFKTEGDAVRATHLIQYLITGSNETPEHELLLNKILCGIKLATPVPLQIELTDKEKETSDLMLKGVIQNWEKLKSSSIDAMREGFFVRQGFIEEKDDFWELEVEKKTIDILLKSLPWGFGTVKLPWMSKRMIVNWT
ncbi:contractile injection system tape measure protein [Cyclobacteriaceae bacterium]|nr:contractile injection system tape measure protein [Cyclobacteriaceae bacterium]